MQVMDQIKDSNLYYPNRFGLITIKALEDVMGTNGLNAILNLVNMSDLIDNFPPTNLSNQFDFANYSRLNYGLEETYGPRGGRGLALRAGRATFTDALKDFGAMAGTSDLAFKALPLGTKLKIGLPAMAKIFSTISDQETRVSDLENDFHYTIYKCPVCWGRSGEDRPVCFIAVGLLQEGLKWLSDGKEFRVNESHCFAKGDNTCNFVIQKQPLE
jgi:predicted hydrocarbon binding protein